MEQITTKHRRVARSRSEIVKLLEAFKQSGSSAKEFCKVQDIGEATFYKWKMRYGKEYAALEKQGSFIPLQIVSPAPNSDATLFAEVRGIKIYHRVAASYLKELLR